MKFSFLDFLLPRETKFFKLFIEQAGDLIEAAQLFRELATQLKGMKGEEVRELVSKIKVIESSADSRVADLTQALSDTFITPFDREDILAIGHNIDYVTGRIYGLACKIDIYDIKKLPKNAQAFAELIVEAAEGLKRILEDMEHKRDLIPGITAIHHIETNADYLFSLSVGDLFKRESDPIDIIKLKEVYEQTEDIVNGIDNVAKLIRRVVVKQG